MVPCPYRPLPVRPLNKEEVKEDTAEKTKDEGTGRGEKYEDKTKDSHLENKAYWEATRPLRRLLNKHEEVGNLGGDYYLPADPRLVEVHDYSTSVPRTGADRSTPKAPIASSLLYSQHQEDNQHKNGGSEPIAKNRHAKIVSGVPGDGARYQGTGSQEADDERDDERRRRGHCQRQAGR